jgi:uncharacterized surface protein with fasciclin (FAS1) repeats
MKPIFHIIKTIEAGLRRDTRVRWGVGAGASVLLSAGVLGMGGSLVPELLHASTTKHGIIPQERIQAHGLDIVDMSTSTVSQIIETLPQALRFELMLYNSGAGDTLKHRGIYTVFVPASADFDYLPKRYIATLTRTDTAKLAQAHMVAQALPLDEALNGDVPTLGGTMLSFAADASARTIAVNGAKVLKAYKASNGYVYIINKVLADTE